MLLDMDTPWYLDLNHVRCAQVQTDPSTCCLAVLLGTRNLYIMNQRYHHKQASYSKTEMTFMQPGSQIDEPSWTA